MTIFIKRGTEFKVTTEAAIDMHHTLPAGNYVVKKDPFEELYLEQVDSFTFKGKVYGETQKQVDRIINTFNERTASTGVLLNGEKGSGKTLLSKLLSIECAKQGIPTIIVNAPWCGDKFNTLIQQIEQPVVILFDEFEKVYDRDDQQQVLTLMDGVFPTRKLFVMTVNDKYRVDEHMRNRPGRIYYLLDFEGLDPQFITEYCEDNLKDKSHINSICKISTMFHAFNFDMLKAMVEEMNRYGESPREVLKMLNAKPTKDDGSKYTVELTVGGVKSNNFYPEVLRANPLAIESVSVEDYGNNDDDRTKSYSFTHNDIAHLDVSSGIIRYKRDDTELVLTKVKDFKFDFSAF